MTRRRSVFVEALKQENDKMDVEGKTEASLTCIIHGWSSSRRWQFGNHSRPEDCAGEARAFLHSLTYSYSRLAYVALPSELCRS